jgi:hypothetical protein
MSSPKEYLVEVCAFAAFSYFCLELQRLKKRAKDTVIEDLKPTGDSHLVLNNSRKLCYINPTHGVCGIPSNRSIIAYQELGIMVIFDHFQFLDNF